MTTNEIKDFLLFCIIINYAILFVWAGAFIFAHDRLYGLHSRWFKLTAETFDAVHYAGLGIYKIGILLLNLVPFIGLCLLA